MGTVLEYRIMSTINKQLETTIVISVIYDIYIYIHSQQQCPSGKHIEGPIHGTINNDFQYGKVIIPKI